MRAGMTMGLTHIFLNYISYVYLCVPQILGHDQVAIVSTALINFRGLDSK